MARLIFWTLLAWPLPACFAEAMGWKGIWGSGGALVDYLIPLPVAGGMLHLPSFIVCGLIVNAMPLAGEAAAARMRAFLIGAVIGGVLMLLRLDEILLAFKTLSSYPSRLWHDNPLGLFFLSDGVIALLLTVATPQRPWLKLELPSAMAFAIPVLLPFGMVERSMSVEPFMHGTTREGPARGDQVHMMFTKLGLDAPDFRQRAEGFVAQHHPRYLIGVDDVAVLFTRDLDAARRFDTGKAAMTLCLYEDGTPSRWLPGNQADECFESHVTFIERLTAAYEARPKSEMPEIKDYMARKSVCVGVKTIPPSGDTGGMELSGMRECSRRKEAREALLRKYPEAAAVVDVGP